MPSVQRLKVVGSREPREQAILGDEDGLKGDYSPLALKRSLDFIAALTFASVLGWGVLLSAGTVLVVQGSLTLGAGLLEAVVS